MPTGKKIEKQNEERAKIEKIDHRCYDLTNRFSRRRAIYDVFDKINEIIDYLEVLNEK